LQRFSPLILLLLCCASLATAKVPDVTMEDVIEQGIFVDLKEPEYCDGVISTDRGGVITGPEIRVQARRIRYTKKKVEGELVNTIVAEGDLMLQFGEYTFVGERLEFDLLTNSGTILNGRASIEPWSFGGRRIRLLPNKSFLINDCTITTSESLDPDWRIEAKEAKITCKKYLTAADVKFRILRLPLFWMPKFKADLETIFDSPIHYTVRWGGQQGPRAGMVYEVFSWNNLKTFLRVDYRMKRGWGGGIETHFLSDDRCQSFKTINYIARDSSISNPDERVRYRFQGSYHGSFHCGKSRAHLCYDKLSDKDMAEDYHDESLVIEEAGRTELLLHHHERSWTANFITRLQLNSWQTVNQRLPTLSGSLRPFVLGNSGIVSDSRFSASYLAYEYANNVTTVPDYNSTRLSWFQKFYRTFSLCGWHFTPEAGLAAIHYGNGPDEAKHNLATGLFSCSANTHFHRFYGPCCKHVAEPYGCYSFFTAPTSSPNRHYIFTIEDGWYRMNMLEFGLRNNFYIKERGGCIRRLVGVDLFTHSFFDTETLPYRIPKLQGRLTFYPCRTLRYTLHSGWNLQFNELDFFNSRIDWTLSENLALATEYRHRSRYDWRKVDRGNYILDSFRSIPSLLASSLSDRRDTILLHAFFRFNPDLAVEAQLRNGWNRRQEPSYIEYQTDLIANLGAAWSMKISYQHKEDDHRLAFYFNLGAPKPNRRRCCPVPCIDF